MSKVTKIGKINGVDMGDVLSKRHTIREESQTVWVWSDERTLIYYINTGFILKIGEKYHKGVYDPRSGWLWSRTLDMVWKEKEKKKQLQKEMEVIAINWKLTLQMLSHFSKVL